TANRSRASLLGLRRLERLTLALDGACEEIEPVLPPKDLAVQHIAGRADDAGRDRFGGAARIDRPHRLGLRSCEHVLGVMPRLRQQLGELGARRTILCGYPAGLPDRAHEPCRIAARFDDSGDAAICRLRIEGPMLRLQLHGHAAKFPPALQLE